MKTFIPSLTTGIFATALAVCGLVHAQSPTTERPAASSSASPSSTPQLGDPFVKNTPANAAPLHRAVKEPAPLFNLGFTVEVYAMAPDEGAKLINEANDEALHERVLELAHAGKARFETLMAGVTKSGQRSVNSQVDEFRYPTEFKQPLAPGESPVPIAFETRNVGEQLDFEPVLSADHHSCDIHGTLAPVRFLCYAKYTGKDVAIQPWFDSPKNKFGCSLPIGVPTFLYSESGTGKTPNEALKNPQVRLAFGRVNVIDVAPPKPVQDTGERADLEHVLSIYSLDREAARKILTGEPKSGAYYAAVRALADQHQARLVQVIVVPTKSGQRCTSQSVQELRYPLEYDEKLAGTGSGSEMHSGSASSHKTAKSVAYPTSFETTNAGLVWEMEPVLGPNGVVDINVVPQCVQNLGDISEASPLLFPQQPLFEVRKALTTFSAALGEQAFVGTLNPPAEGDFSERKDINPFDHDAQLITSGFATLIRQQPDKGLVWLAFLKTTLADREGN